jgi:hypothetical protein
MIKDLFNEIVRRMEWAKERKLTPEIQRRSLEFLCRIPVDADLTYVVSIQESKTPGVVLQSFFPDGESHYYVKIAELQREEAISLVNAAALIVYGRLLPGGGEDKGR